MPTGTLSSGHVPAQSSSAGKPHSAENHSSAPLAPRPLSASVAGNEASHGAPLSAADGQTGLKRLHDNLALALRGKHAEIDLLMIALLSGGSVLMEDVPGVGKTTLAKALARSLDLPFQRIQFTPDMLPTDILGASVFHPEDGSFVFRPGPIFCSILLADEINRASPRTQSALLEAMSELQVTLDGERRRLPEPFLVLATQNPVEYQGTYPLPEAQLDRFLMQIELGYPDPETEVAILYAHRQQDPLETLQPVLSQPDVIALQHAVQRVEVEESLARYLVELVGRTRRDSRIRLGVSPRGALMLFRAAQAAALLAGRSYVLPDDVQRLAGPVLAHRLIVHHRARGSVESKAELVAEIVAETPIPT